jgi:DNA-binding NarL/FixJ family response regulator
LWARDGGARAAHQQGEYPRAQSLHEEALAVVEGQPRRAWRLVGAAEQLRAACRSPLSPAERADLSRRLEPTRKLLGHEAVLSLTDEGRALRTADALELTRATPVSSLRAGTEDVLTPREREVAALLGRGLTNRQIGERLSITRRTVAAHVEHILSALPGLVGG